MDNRLRHGVRNAHNAVHDAFKSYRISSNVIIIMVSIVAVIIMVFIVKYGMTDCQNKKPFSKYLMGLNLFEVCERGAVDDTDKEIRRLNKSQHPTLDYVEREIMDDEEVFHINNQDYTYDQAKCKCASYGAKLATYEQMVKAYNKGGDWCSYGWNQGQKAYYPTQKCTWDRLQRGPKGGRNTCGKPGINGGYFANPDLKFGVNCWGVKPAGEVAIPKPAVCTAGEYCSQPDVRRKVGKLESDEISSFNDKQWSMSQ